MAGSTAALESLLFESSFCLHIGLILWIVFKGYLITLVKDIQRDLRGELEVLPDPAAGGVLNAGVGRDCQVLGVYLHSDVVVGFYLLAFLDNVANDGAEFFGVRNRALNLAKLPQGLFSLDSLVLGPESKLSGDGAEGAVPGILGLGFVLELF